MNAIRVISLYRYNGLWVFDDSTTGLIREPFISGMGEIIDAATAHIPLAKSGVRALFAETHFPGWGLHLQWQRAEGGGNWYYAPKLNMTGWLCPALLLYFPRAPSVIYARFEGFPHE